MNNKQGKEGLKWTKNLIKRMIYLSLVHWQIRNDWVHDMTKQENIREKKNKVNDKITEWYEKKSEFEKEAGYLFKIPLLGRCMKSLKNKEAWLRTIELEYECLKGRTVE